MRRIPTCTVPLLENTNTECSNCSEIYDDEGTIFHKCHKCKKIVCDNCLHRDHKGNVWDWNVFKDRYVVCIDCTFKYIETRKQKNFQIKLYSS